MLPMVASINVANGSYLMLKLVMLANVSVA